MKKLLLVISVFAMLVVGVYAFHDSTPIFVKINNAGYTNGDFLIRYTDFNLEEVNLYVNDEKTESFDYCDSGRNVECDIWADLPDFDEQKIEYFFELIDEDENIQYSNIYSAFVDISDPTISKSSISISGRSMTFNFQVEDDNPLKIEYSDNGKPWKTLCSGNLVINCNKKRYFSKGYHDILVRVSDKAGNYAEESFLVDV
ncbi:hypothetical protein COU56_02800 [Candidatus Pacearchaeota archaeon CG10_big_fil_rev_8_21_14_0_10_31_9]|nr:MAG: hypothetical protein COU56_02800 [Candidatus Pacearchaeota archaeon CG10_big_fil_rev_8_21_14_0_10_31_9]PIZ82617.1 MAG: hypothetical protein COX97_03845 [Candidatus Pacearchaeota archaeon CG_4_10_14_0_2_um_filter_05_32_18]